MWTFYWCPLAQHHKHQKQVHINTDEPIHKQTKKWPKLDIIFAEKWGKEESCGPNHRKTSASESTSVSVEPTPIKWTRRRLRMTIGKPRTSLKMGRVDAHLGRDACQSSAAVEADVQFAKPDWIGALCILGPNPLKFWCESSSKRRR